MTEVNPATGRPIAEVRKQDEINKINRLEEKKAKSDQLISDISSEKGQLILHKIQEQFLNRVNYLISQDGECKAYKNILKSMGLEISMANMAVERLMKLVDRQTR